MVGTMSENTLNATLRTTQGKSSTHLIRRNGKIPAIIYGPRGNFSLEMDEESTRQSLEKLNNIHDLLLPNLKVVLSLRYPAIGSEIASHILEILKITPITAGAMRSTSVENFMTYKLIRRYI